MGLGRDELPAQLGELGLEHPQVAGRRLVLLRLRHFILDLLDLPDDVPHGEAAGALQDAAPPQLVRYDTWVGDSGHIDAIL